MKRPHILIVEDDEFVQGLLAAYLEKEGYVITCAGSGQEMFALLEGIAFDLIVLDLGLPDEDGLVLARQLRTNSNIPLFILTSRRDVDDRISAFELGADDFVTKPAEPKELSLRIGRLLSRGLAPNANKNSPDRKIKIGSLTLDIDARNMVDATGKQIPLTRSEFNLLAALFKSPNHVLSRDQLLDAIHRGDASPTDRTIDVLVSRVRKKLGESSASSKYIITVAGIGYKLSPDPE